MAATRIYDCKSRSIPANQSSLGELGKCSQALQLSDSQSSQAPMLTILHLVAHSSRSLFTVTLAEYLWVDLTPR